MSLVSFPCWSADFDKGSAAYDRGDFETALREWTLLADQGHAEAQCNLALMYDNVQLRQPISMEDLKKVQSLCREIDDEMRWLIALISDTGMRLGETAGLLKKDIKLDERIPHIDLKPHPWRTLKTKGSHKAHTSDQRGSRGF